MNRGPHRLFGTDGVRGIANAVLTPELAFALGRAGAYVLASQGRRRPVVIGRDTRCSGTMLEGALSAGICSVGLDVVHVGILPTPAVAWLTHEWSAAAGVMISASHNPIDDNGIKFFAADGCKLPDAVEDEIAGLVENASSLPRPVGARVGRVHDRRRRARRKYEEHCQALGADLSGKTIVVDGAHGAGHAVGPAVLERLGARVVGLHCTPNGRRINVNCGSTDLRPLQAAVRAHRAFLGVAFDGDADRALFVDEQGDIVTGDHVLAIVARDLMSRGELPHATVVATVMSNIGLERALATCGIRLVRTPVGDRYVLEALRRGGYRLGGEQSGHIIDIQANPTGDGIATAVRVASLAVHSGSLHALSQVLQLSPQVLVNVAVSDKRCVEHASVRQTIADVERMLGVDGRLLVRPSGTEQLIRIMIEGSDEAQIKKWAARIADDVRRASTEWPAS